MGITVKVVLRGNFTDRLSVFWDWLLLDHLVGQLEHVSEKLTYLFLLVDMMIGSLDVPPDH